MICAKLATTEQVFIEKLGWVGYSTMIQIQNSVKEFFQCCPQMYESFCSKLTGFQSTLLTGSHLQMCELLYLWPSFITTDLVFQTLVVCGEYTCREQLSTNYFLWQWKVPVSLILLVVFNYETEGNIWHCIKYFISRMLHDSILLLLM